MTSSDFVERWFMVGLAQLVIGKTLGWSPLSCREMFLTIIQLLVHICACRGGVQIRLALRPLLLG